MVESFFASLKTERTARKVYRIRDEARADVFDYIETFYNQTRGTRPWGISAQSSSKNKVDSLKPVSMEPAAVNSDGIGARGSLACLKDDPVEGSRDNSSGRNVWIRKGHSASSNAPAAFNWLTRPQRRSPLANSLAQPLYFIGYAYTLLEVTMRTRPETQPEINKFRRETLIAATIKVVAKHGIENTTIAKICEAAGVSRGLSGHYFRDKNDLLSQAYRHLLTSHFDRTVAAAEAVRGPAAERLKAIVQASFPSDGNSRINRTAYLAFWALSMSHPDVAKITSDAYRVFYASIEALLHRAAAEADLTIDTDEAATALIGMIDGLWLDISIGAHGVTVKGAVTAISRHIDRILSPNPTVVVRPGQGRRATRKASSGA